MRRYQVIILALLVISAIFAVQIRNFVSPKGEDLGGDERKKQLESISLNRCTDDLLKFRTSMGFDLFVHCSAADRYVSQSLQNDQKTVVEYRDFLAADIKRKLKDNKEVVALDIGANVGYYTVWMARNGARVVAFEPLPANIRVLQANIDLHGLSNQVHVVAAATGLKEGKSTLSLTPNSPGASTLGSASQMPWPMKKEGLEVRVCNGLDELKTLGIAHADLIKIDVEGFELSALRGLGNLKALGVHSVVTEFFPALITANGIDPTAFLRFLQDQGFSAWTDWRTPFGAHIPPTKFESFAKNLPKQNPADLYCRWLEPTDGPL
jgi:FkbM family methyltransferase